MGREYQLTISGGSETYTTKQSIYWALVLKYASRKLEKKLTEREKIIWICFFHHGDNFRIILI